MASSEHLNFTKLWRKKCGEKLSPEIIQTWYILTCSCPLTAQITKKSVNILPYLTMIWNADQQGNIWRKNSCIYCISSYNALPRIIPAHLYSYSLAFLRRPQGFAQSSSWFWHLLSKRQNHEEECSNFCGLLRKAELYVLWPLILCTVTLIIILTGLKWGNTVSTQWTANACGHLSYVGRRYIFQVL